MVGVLAQASNSAASKSLKSALCVIPSRTSAIYQAMQEVRCFNDKSFSRWPPHVNLLYPFVPDEGRNFAVAAERASAAVRGLRPFQMLAHRLKFFEHGRSCTMWLETNDGELVSLQRALVRAFPDCTDLSDDPSRGIEHFTPHMSVGQWRTRVEVTEAMPSLQESFRPMGPVDVASVALISRKGFDDPFQVRFIVPFDGSAPREVNVPYVPTLGPGPPPSAGDLAHEIGIGASQEGVWSFAFGANMSSRKLATRAMRPLESVAGRLPGWRLEFTHRGGFGTIVQASNAATTSSGGQDLHGSYRHPGDAVHGVLHRLTPAQLATLANMEHEYRPIEIDVQRYDGQGDVRAVAFVTPLDKAIRPGLPPPNRYLTLLREGAEEWRLDGAYTSWLNGVAGVDGRDRHEAYYQAHPSGLSIPMLPKIRTGSQPKPRNRRFVPVES